MEAIRVRNIATWWSRWYGLIGFVILLFLLLCAADMVGKMASKSDKRFNEVPVFQGTVLARPVPVNKFGVYQTVEVRPEDNMLAGKTVNVVVHYSEIARSPELFSPGGKIRFTAHEVRGAPMTGWFYGYLMPGAKR